MIDLARNRAEVIVIEVSVITLFTWIKMVVTTGRRATAAETNNTPYAHARCAAVRHITRLRIHSTGAIHITANTGPLRRLSTNAGMTTRVRHGNIALIFSINGAVITLTFGSANTITAVAAKNVVIVTLLVSFHNAVAAIRSHATLTAGKSTAACP